MSSKQSRRVIIILCVISSTLAGPLSEHGVVKRQLSESSGYDYDTSIQHYPREGGSVRENDERDRRIYNRPAVKYKGLDTIDSMSNLAAKMDEEDYRRPQQGNIVAKSPISVSVSRDETAVLNEMDAKANDDSQGMKIRELLPPRTFQRLEGNSPAKNEKNLAEKPPGIQEVNRVNYAVDPMKYSYNQDKHPLDETKNDAVSIERPLFKVDENYGEVYDIDEARDANKEKRDSDEYYESYPVESEAKPSAQRQKGKRDTGENKIKESKYILPIIVSNFSNVGAEERRGSEPMSNKREASRYYQDGLITLEDKHRIETALDKLLKDAIQSRSSSFADSSQNGPELNDLLNEDQLRAIIRGTNALLSNGVGVKKTVEMTAPRAVNLNSAPKDASCCWRCKCQVKDAIEFPPQCCPPARLEQVISNTEEDSLLVDIRKTTKSTCPPPTSSCAGTSNAQ